MTDISTVETSSLDANNEETTSLWGKTFDITSLKANPKRWNQEWETMLATFSAQEAYSTIGGLFKKPEILDRQGITFASMSSELTASVCKMQGLALEIWRKSGVKDHLVTAWLLLKRSEHERHLLEGLKEASERCALNQDLRVLCPEIRTSLFLARGGRAFTDFVESYVVGREAVEDATVLYLLPSVWWDGAGNGTTESALNDLDESIPILLTLLRNEFISQFLVHSLMSLFGDLMNEGSAMNPIKNLMKEQPIFARALGKALSSHPDKPLIRCENCTKSPEDIGGTIEFMVCSVCKTKLQFKVHYCSADCQKQDWPLHKKHCGKQKASKKLKGTAQDPLWKYPEVPDHLRSLVTPGRGISVGETGFGPASAISSYSPALQRQVALLRADREADYFLFDIHDRPVRFVISDPMIKMTFRMNRSEALTPGADLRVETMAEYMVKAMAQRPGLSREGIFAQLQREYECDVEKQLARFSRVMAAQGYPEGTFLENMSKGLLAVMPEMGPSTRGTSR